MQKRFFNFLDDDKTWDLAGMNMAVNQHGRLSGFDGIKGTDITNFGITHLVTGYNRITALQQTDHLGAWSSKQGVIITENAPLNGLSLNMNLTAFPRVDTLIGSHEYISTQGGSEAYYSIATGSAAETPTPAPVADSGRDVILGYFIIKPNTTTLETVTFCPANSVYLKNDFEDARYNTPGNFTHNLVLDSVTVGMGSVEVLKNTITLLPLEIKDKLVHNYPHLRGFRQK